MMGPLAGVGDPIFWGTLRPICAALGASLAMGGSLLGPILFFVLFNVVRLLIRWYGIKYGYTKGTDIIQDVAGNTLQKITEGASILGLFVMGALVNKWTTVNIPVVISEVTMQDGSVVTNYCSIYLRPINARSRTTFTYILMHETYEEKKSMQFGLSLAYSL